MRKIALAFGLSWVFFVLWYVTPLSDWEFSALRWIGSLLADTPVGAAGRNIEEYMRAPLIMWTELFTYIAFFYVAWAIVGRRRPEQDARPTV